jgi:hypothetical protein
LRRRILEDDAVEPPAEIVAAQRCDLHAARARFDEP